MTQFGEHTGVEKLGLSSKDWTSEYIAKIAELFPQVLTESQDEHGRLRKAINFDKLKDILSHDLAQGRESYEFTWVGKRDAMAEAGRPTTKTLRPDLAESANFDETENVFITGDNLEVLKILQESYLNKIDMIYIDPPYNTGKDFVYSDKFSQKDDEYEAAIEIRDDEGRLHERLKPNLKTSGRYHSKWLNMMYPRLVLARNVLKDTGVIFISIDDNEQANLKALCDEIFGEENFINSLPTIMNLKGNNDQFGFSGTHEYTLVYAKKINSLENLGGLPLDSNDIKEYSLIDNKGRYKKGATLMRTGEAGARRFRPKGYYPIYVSEDLKRMSLTKLYDSDFEIYPKTTSGKEMSWRRSPENLENTIDEFIITKSKQGISFYKKQRLEEIQKVGKKAKTLFYKPEYSSGNGTAAVVDLLGGRYFDNPKPTTLLKDFQHIGLPEDGIVLDFFAGSATTADAVMQLNAEDGGNRKYILCTLDEAVADKSVAKEAGYQTIDQISRERIRRAAEKIRTENPDKVDNLDLGFKAFKLDTSNFKDVYQMPDHYQQVNLLDSISNLKANRDDMDILFQIMLTWGMELSLSIKNENLEGTNIYNVDGNSLIACFADNLNEEVIRSIAKKEPLRVVFKDESFINSASKINLAQIFEEISPKTKVKVI
ncbi:site-specific DNA-methyltransferase [Streptococcus uberis]|uniref:site-specific DNA-methyltransferase n=1 Tax=Streptococcus uberis TaxID=1349 RepID=UPI001C98B4BD|nr:site-specific DNA-methyltransferase [Streptococcus uberis]MBY4765372.1 site-specific DNA-methyltransferase [Streptococcus uberis]